MEIIGSQKKTCPEKRGHTIGVLLTVESQVTLLKLEQLKIKDGKVRSMLCSHQGMYIMPTGGCIHQMRMCAYWRWHSQKSVERCLCY